MSKKLLAFIIGIVLICSLVTCAYAAPNTGAKPQTFRFNLYTNPLTLDPARIVDSTGFTLAQALFEGLTRLTKSGKAEPAMAKSWEISQDGKTYTFHLRTAAYWSNNQKVKASDFVFAWKRALDPKLNSDYAFLLYCIQNAESFNQGKLKDASTVGVKALNDNTLQVTLKEKTAYFLQLLASPVYSPVPASLVKANPAWSNSAKTLVSNGPFYMKSWTSGKQMILAKNSHYADAKQVHFNEVRMRIMDDSEQELKMYMNNQIDWSGANETNLNLRDLDAKTAQDLHSTGMASTYYYVFNVTKKPFDNVNIRRALSIAIERGDLVYSQPAYGFVPPGIQGSKLTFREEYSDKAYVHEDIELAKQLLQKGLTEEGLKELPPITLISNENLGNDELTYGVQEMWKQNLGIHVNIDFQDWNDLLQNRRTMNYQIARAGWGADYNDPSTFLDIFTSWSSMNDSGWSNEEYDAYIQQAQQSLDAKTRMELYRKAEKLLMDQMVIVPIHYYTVNNLHKAYVQGVYQDFSGNLNFSRGFIK